MIVLVTLRRSSISCESVEAELMRNRLLTAPDAAELRAEAYLNTTRDVVRARSNAVALVLRDFPEATHVLWWDSDVVPPSLNTIARLYQSNYEVVGCPVPRKKIERWNEREACDFTYRVHGEDGATVDRQPDEHNCVEVDALPFGLMLTSTRALCEMTERYWDELWYTDGGLEAVALFQLMLHGEQHTSQGRFRQLLSEDFSFCERWRVMGGRVHMLCEPCAHVGEHVFRGYVEGLRHVR